MLRELDDAPVIVLGLRDIIDDPNVVCELWRKELTYQTVRNYYDEVLIYGCKEVFDAALHYRVEAEFPVAHARGIDAARVVGLLSRLDSYVTWLASRFRGAGCSEMAGNLGKNCQSHDVRGAAFLVSRFSGYRSR